MSKSKDLCRKCIDLVGVECYRKAGMLIPATRLHIVKPKRTMYADGEFADYVDQTIEECPINEQKLKPQNFWPPTGGRSFIEDGALVHYTEEELAIRAVVMNALMFGIGK